MTDQQKDSTKATSHAPQTNHTTEQFLSAHLLAALSNELRAPLATIKGYTTTLLHASEKITAEERLNTLKAINERSNQLARSISRMLELAQLSSGANTLQPTLMNVTQLMQNTIATLTRRQAQGRTIRVQQKTFQGNLIKHDLTAWADAHGLAMVIETLLELVDTSRYSPDDQPVDIIVTPICTEEDRAHLPLRVQSAATRHMMLIRVHDYGLSIAQDQLQQIFSHLQRRDMFINNQSDGLGIGFTLCHYIIALHHGNIWAESKTGSGCIFYIILPTEPTEPMEQEADEK